MSLIQITDLTFGYDGSSETIFENVSFQLDTDWRLGFTGRNGRGKTTFLKLLLGKYEYRGKISATVEFSYFPYEVLDKEKDTMEIVYTMHPYCEHWELVKELSLLQVAEEVLYRPFHTLSSGEQTKVLLAVLFLKENNFLLIDEPTNHLDGETRQVLAKYLKTKKGFILVSHDRVFLDTCIDHILSINKANIDIQRGNYSSWMQNKQLEDSFELAENEKLKKDIKRLSDAAKRSANWSARVEGTKFKGRDASGIKPDKGHIGHKAAKMMKRSKVIENRQATAIEKKKSLLKNIETANPLKITPLVHSSEVLVRCENISIGYGEKSVVKNIQLSIKNGERIALVGKNGSGKSSLLRVICGQEIPFAGRCYTASGLILSYIPQDASFLQGELSEFAYEHQLSETQFKTILRELDFSREDFNRRMEYFSDGQKKKVLLAKSLCEEAHLYVWDEPLNFIDVLSRVQIEEVLLRYAPTLLFVEHDKGFVEKVATRIEEL